MPARITMASAKSYNKREIESVHFYPQKGYMMYMMEQGEDVAGQFVRNPEIENRPVRIDGAAFTALYAKIEADILARPETTQRDPD